MQNTEAAFASSPASKLTLVPASNKRHNPATLMRQTCLESRCSRRSPRTLGTLPNMASQQILGMPKLKSNIFPSFSKIRPQCSYFEITSVRGRDASSGTQPSRTLKNESTALRAYGRQPGSNGPALQAEVHWPADLSNISCAIYDSKALSSFRR